MEFKRKPFVMKIDDSIYELKRPSVRLFKEFQDKFDEKGKDQITPVVEFLGELGLPENIAWEMEPEWLFQVVDEITGKKK